eukprot:CAMPEP_0172486756 /NCGR_PEP_ID=MMETSP1066-20121228/15481_1 /TAXON_ID=671091 /ORGANISM="Coscinodiscus wailesii, Strain CCMP2513" /LENGTH=37 /DNA_ID= /DNA_START= /DNA_END= /DNA_ORIENTATION=
MSADSEKEECKEEDEIRQREEIIETQENMIDHDFEMR